MGNMFKVLLPTSVQSQKIIIGVLILAIVIIHSSSVSGQPDCKRSGPLTSTTWSIAASDWPGKILWQKAEPRERASLFDGDPNSGIATSKGQVLYWQARRDDAHCAQLVAFDLTTGADLWTFPHDPYIPFRRVVTISDGYVFVIDQAITKIGFDGKEIWKNAEFPTRSTKLVFEIKDKLYIPSHSGVYQLSTQTGKLLQLIPVKYPIAYIDNFAIVANSTGTQLNIVDLDKNGQKISNVNLPNPTPLQNALPMLIPVASRYNNILLLYYINDKATWIEAYQIDTGSSLWVLNRQFYGVPLLVGKKLLLYSPQGLEIYDPRNGKLVGTVKLVRTVNGNTDKIDPTHIWLAGYDNTVVINYRDTWELVTLNLDFSSMDGVH